jgi:hypothetical protein
LEESRIIVKATEIEAIPTISESCIRAVAEAGFRESMSKYAMNGYEMFDTENREIGMWIDSVARHVFGNEDIPLNGEPRSYFQFAWAAHAVMLYQVISTQIEGNALE